MKNSKLSEKTLGLVYGLFAFSAWGLLPLYWKMLNQIPADQILAHRILWSFVFVTTIIIFLGKLNSLRDYLMNRKNLSILLICSVLISLNWGTYIWAVNSNFVIEASMGYYMLPLVSVFLGVSFLKEKFNFWQGIAVGMALIGVVIMTVQYGRIPWIALVLAITFGLYGLTKKILQAEPIIGLALETAIIAPVALGYIIFRQIDGSGSLGSVSLPVILLLLGSGIATATPLLWFAESAKRLELSTVGFMEYIAPTISLLLGVFVFKEAFTRIHLISFGFIWMALVIYTVSKTRNIKSAEPLKPKERPHQA
ncbi:MAG: transporter [Desulfitibacter sp. BRH_c19]|nr:MAG: transporter [Desulfitibacter sp. BRH_c19]